jgi:release factor glutamine methyltransferase
MCFSSSLRQILIYIMLAGFTGSRCTALISLRSRSSCNLALAKGCIPARPLGRLFSTVTFPNAPTVGAAYHISSDWLQKNSVEDATDSARHMLCHATGIGSKFSDFNRNLDRVMSTEEIFQYTRMCEERAQREPVQYIIGNWDFYGLTLNCRKPVLIPRPETEELVENILNTGILQKLERPRILDIGAGTGAIGLALISHLPEATCYAIDINSAAADLANENAEKVLGKGHGERYHCQHVDFRSFVRQFCQGSKSTTAGESTMLQPYQPFDLVVSNPPYIPRAKIPSLQPEIKDYEDMHALDGGEDGLDMVRDLVYLAPTLLGADRAGRQGGEMWLEVSEEHPAMVEEWIQRGSYKTDKDTFLNAWRNNNDGAESELSAKPASHVQGMCDLSGNPRFIRLTF